MSDAERFDHERDLMAGLRRLADDTVVPPIDPAQEQQLLAAFDAHWQAPPLRRVRWPLAAAGALATAATLVWAVGNANRPVDAPHAPPTGTHAAVPMTKATVPEIAPTGSSVAVGRPKPARVRKPQTQRAGTADTTFVMWPGARDLPRFESGQLMRVALPASVASSLGLRPPQPSAFVQTDVLVGQDGYARAVRLVQ
jgi:hypothetical protein